MRAEAKPSDSVCVSVEDGGERFEELYRAHSAHVRRVVQRMLPSSPEVDDVVQEVFLAAFQGLGGLANEGALRAWLRTVAIRRCLKVIRRRYACKEELYGMKCAHEPATDSAQESFAQDLYLALGELPVELRRPWVSLRIEGLGFSGVAEAFALSPSTVKRRIREADSRIRRRVAPLSSGTAVASLH